MNSNTKKPPAYHPQPTPKVLQTKAAGVKAPPVYRPQPTPRVAQRKEINHGPKATIQAKPASPRNSSTPVRTIQPHLFKPTAGRPGHAIQLQKKDAEAYAKTNGIGVVVNHQNVTTYVNDASNDKTLRKGLLDAWNLNSASNWIIPEPANLTTNPFHHSQFGTYQNWTNTTSGVNFTTPFGTGKVSAFHNQGAPKLGSNKKDWGNTNLGDSYVEYVAGLRSNGLNDRQIATALLNHNDSAFTTLLEKRAAAMIFATVYLAEEWRKQGAAKIYRAMLRTIEAGTKTFDDFLNDYLFIKSAQSGRQMVGRFYDVFNGDDQLINLLLNEQVYHGNLSPQHNDDYSSDDDLRKDDKKNLKGKRLFAEKHQG